MDGLIATDDFQWAIDLARTGGYNFEGCASVLEHSLFTADVAAALVHCKGSVADVAELLKTTRPKVFGMLKQVPTLAGVKMDVREGNIDKLERMHMNDALGGDKKARTHILNTLGKSRGYSPKIIVEGPRNDGIDALLNAAATGHKVPSEIDITPEDNG